MDYVKAKIGWNDRRAMRDFPIEYEKWSTRQQISYEFGRQLAVINRSINSYPGDKELLILKNASSKIVKAHNARAAA